MKTPKQVIQDWVSAYNARDPHALIELYHDDAENHQVAFGDPLNGREGHERYKQKPSLGSLAWAFSFLVP